MLHTLVSSKLREKFHPNAKLAFQHQFTIQTGEDVGVYSTGPGSNLVQGAFEQSYIAYIVSYASCIGPVSNKNPACLDQKVSNAGNAQWTQSFALVLTVSFLNMLCDNIV